MSHELAVYFSVASEHLVNVTALTMLGATALIPGIGAIDDVRAHYPITGASI